MRERLVISLAVLALCFLAGPLTGCGKKDEQTAKGRVTAQEVKQKAKEAFQAAREFSLQEKEEYLKKMEARLDALDRRTAELRAEAARKGEKAKADLEQKLKKLKRKEKAARKKLRELKSAGAEAWGDIIIFLDKTATKLDKALEKAAPSSR